MEQFWSEVCLYTAMAFNVRPRHKAKIVITREQIDLPDISSLHSPPEGSLGWRGGQTS